MEDVKARMRRKCRMAGPNVFDLWDSDRGAAGSERASGVQQPETVAVAKRTRTKPAAPLEQDVLSATFRTLLKLPQIAWVGRFNSGAMQTQYKGKKGFYRFNTLPKGLSMSDLAGQLRDGRFFALECKRPGWKKPSDDREQAQAAFLARVNENGGIGRFFTSVEEALDAVGFNNKWE